MRGEAEHDPNHPTQQNHAAPRRAQQSAASHSTLSHAQADPSPDPSPPAPINPLAHAHPHRPQALPAEPHRAVKAQQSKAAPRRAGPYEVGRVQSGRGIGRGVYPRAHSPRHDRHPHIPFAVMGLGCTLNFAREEAERFLFLPQRTGLPRKVVTPVRWEGP